MSPPSLRALRAFAATSRTGSLAAAARGLHITPPAVSHLLHDLKQSLAMTLFITRLPRVRLTEAGDQPGRRWWIATWSHPCWTRDCWRKSRPIRRFEWRRDTGLSRYRNGYLPARCGNSATG